MVSNSIKMNFLGMQNMAILQLLVVYGILGFIVCKDPPSVEIDGFRFTGTINDSYSYQSHEYRGSGTSDVYLGVPYAKPPVGALRFQKPEPIEYSHDYVLTQMPPSCPQYTEQPIPWYSNDTNQSEDCLYLNIWAPSYDEDIDKDEKKAVLFWIYGGGHRYGSINHPFYNGVHIAGWKRVVVVTVNYRVGYFGFLTSNSAEAPGNAGLWDVLEALKWVNKNIDKFGGDPNNVTIAGEAGGAVTVGYLAVSSQAQGLFNRQIIMANSAVTRRINKGEQNVELSQKMSEYLGCANDSYTITDHPKQVVECMQGVDAEKLAKADYEIAPYKGFNLIPQFGDEFLPEDPRVAIINGDFTCTDLFIGTAKDPGAYRMTANEYRDTFGFFGEKDPHVDRSLAEEMIRTNLDYFENPDDIVNYYLPDDLTNDDNYEIRNQTCAALGDVDFTCPTVYYAEKCAEQGKNVYFYEFVHRPAYSPWAKWMGTTLFDVVPYFFAFQYSNFWINPQYFLDSYMGQETMEVFTNFVKRGYPTISKWPLYSKDKPDYANIERGVKYGPKKLTNIPNAENCDFLRPHFGL